MPSLSRALFSPLLNEQGWTRDSLRFFQIWWAVWLWITPWMRFTRLGLAGKVKRGSGCWEGAQGKNQGAGRETPVVSDCLGLCILLESVFKWQTDHPAVPLIHLLTLGYNNWGLYSLWYTHSQHCSDNRRQPAAVCSHPVEREAMQSHIKAIVKVRFATSRAFWGPVHLSFESLPVWVGIMSWGLLRLRVRGWLRARWLGIWGFWVRQRWIWGSALLPAD